MPKGKHARHRHRPCRRVLASATTLSLPLLGLFAFASDAGASVIYPTCPESGVTRTGEQSEGVEQDNAGQTWDLTGAVFSDPDLFPYPIRSESWQDGCIVGGSVLGPIDPAATRDQWYNSGTHGGADHEGVRITHGSAGFAVVRDTYVEDVEDGFDPNAPTPDAKTYLDHVHASNVRDDCIENEKEPHDMYVRDSLFDGCFAAFAEKPSGSSVDAGRGESEFVVEESLVYVKPQPLGDGYCSDSNVDRGRCIDDGNGGYLGAYGMFKWGEDAASTLVVRNTIFRMDLASYSSCSGNRFPTNGVYENVTLVWTGEGDWESAGGCDNVVPHGVTVTTDVSVWDRAKAAWLAGGGTPDPTPETTPETTPEPTPETTPEPTPEPTEEPTAEPSASPEPDSKPGKGPKCRPVVRSPMVRDKVTCTYR
ncbi:MAG TPA: hypothetical protein VLB29_14720 [Nocardioidaceae bacterium]|nr:hypothetical protein [Nocardioidaceae bacterium]